MLQERPLCFDPLKLKRPFNVTGKRVHESVMKTCTYYDVTLSPLQSELKKEAATTEGNLVR
jgi:hypothetical protein